MSEATLGPGAAVDQARRPRRVTGLTNAQLAAGRGTYVNDVSLPGMTWMAFLRSPHAHARIRSLDASAARARPGVVLVLTGEDAQRDMRPDPRGLEHARDRRQGRRVVSDRQRIGSATSARSSPPSSPRTAGRLRPRSTTSWSTTRSCPRSPIPIAAMQPGADLVEPSWGDNLLITRDWRAGDVDAAFADADRTSSGDGAVQSDHRGPDRGARLRRELGPLPRDSSRSGSPPRTRTRCGPSWPRPSSCPRATSTSSSRMSAERSG